MVAGLALERALNSEIGWLWFFPDGCATNVAVGSAATEESHSISKSAPRSVPLLDAGDVDIGIYHKQALMTREALEFEEIVIVRWRRC